MLSHWKAEVRSRPRPVLHYRHGHIHVVPGHGDHRQRHQDHNEPLTVGAPTYRGIGTDRRHYRTLPRSLVRPTDRVTLHAVSANGWQAEPTRGEPLLLLRNPAGPKWPPPLPLACTATPWTMSADDRWRRDQLTIKLDHTPPSWHRALSTVSLVPASASEQNTETSPNPRAASTMLLQCRTDGWGPLVYISRQRRRLAVSS